MMDAIKRYFRSPAAVVGLLLLLVVIVMAITASWIYPRDPLALAGRPLIWPFSNPRFLLGTDNSGRDIAAQIFYRDRLRRRRIRLRQIHVRACADGPAAGYGEDRDR
jgi:peptide/nickel transport system permease protein